MASHHQPSNDAAPLDLRGALSMSLQLVEPEVTRAEFKKVLDASLKSIAWDEAASCLARGDFAGHDSAMRIFRRLG